MDTASEFLTRQVLLIQAFSKLLLTAQDASEFGLYRAHISNAALAIQQVANPFGTTELALAVDAVAPHVGGTTE